MWWVGVLVTPPTPACDADRPAADQAILTLYAKPLLVKAFEEATPDTLPDWTELLRQGTVRDLAILRCHRGARSGRRTRVSPARTQRRGIVWLCGTDPGHFRPTAFDVDCQRRPCGSARHGARSGLQPGPQARAAAGASGHHRLASPRLGSGRTSLEFSPTRFATGGGGRHFP